MSKLNHYIHGRAGAMRMGRLPVTCTCGEFLRLLIIVTCTVLGNSIMSSAQDSKGFFSIDFGSDNGAPYRDSKTGLMWETDGKYGLTGMSGVVPYPVDPFLENHKALQRFRYFPVRRSRHCLSLRNEARVFFLIRTMFLHGGAAELPLPIKFQVFVNATSWFIVEYDKPSGPSLGIPKVMEGIFYATGVTNLCLVPIYGVPFISSFELRQLDMEEAMYSFSGHQNLFLNTLIRLNLGVPATSSVLRYPDDRFDRFWAPPQQMVLGKAPRDIDVFSGSSSFFPNATTPQANNVPPEVMKSAWVGYNLSELDASFALTSNLSYLHEHPVDYAYAVLYIWTANSTRDDNSSKLQGMNVALNGFEEQPFYLSSTTFTMEDYPSLYLGTKNLDLTLNNFPLSYTPPGPPLLNAIEVYEEIIFNISFTGPVDDAAITQLLHMFNVTEWQGDPCAPVPLDWVTCDHVLSWDSLLIIDSIALSNLDIGAGTAMGNLTGLKNYSSAYVLHTLESFSLTDSNVGDEAMLNLTKYFSFPNLQILNLSNNSMKTLPLNGDPLLGQFWPLRLLNLSHNELIAAPSFVHWKFANELKTLDLSYNNIGEFPEDWLNSSMNTLGSLKVLNLSYNNIGITVSTLERFLTGNFVSLQEIYMSDNNLTGPFPEVPLITYIPNLRILNLDRNFIQGTLNLTTWYEIMQHVANDCGAKDNVSCSFSSIDKLITFVDNGIHDIIPSSKVLKSAIDNVLQNFPNFTQRGILLGGNPYCLGAKSATDKYLCRSTVDDKFEGFQKKGTKVAWKILAALATACGCIICCSLLLIIWKLVKQVTSLKEIQEALAEQRVKPPFYSFKDLKIGTRDFREKNKLGKGAFGAVYKGVLKDGSTVAVKKLFNNRKVQVLNEFLNEVVLITGIKHRNLVQLKGCCIEERQRILIYEYCENGNLADALWGRRNFGILSWEQRFQICVGIARGLCYLHEEIQPRIIHRDIKPANILLDENLNCKIADFGLARPFLDEESQANFTNIAGTPAYFAPEYATQGQLTVKADVYSFGLLVLEIFSGRRCVDATLPSERAYLRNWALSLHKDGMLLELLQPEFKKSCPNQEVIRMINIGLICVQMDPENRPTMSQVLTMLMGSMEVTNFVNSSKFYLLDFETLLPPIRDTTGHIDTTLDVMSDLDYSSNTDVSYTTPFSISNGYS